jgi:XTP/dITP diphosphohydrolase
MKLVLASNNAKKLKELREILTPHGWELIPQGELGVSEAEEPHCTFVENALAKARHAAQMTGLPALADDSGLCVDALGGLPGVQSARYAGEPKSDARNNEKLLAALADAGFGYDPLFYIREADQTAAEMDAAEKNRRSHRGQALSHLLERLQARR